MEEVKPTQPLQDLFVWVNNTFNNDITLEIKNFNVSSYTPQQKIDATLALSKEGYVCVLENNNNSLKVTLIRGEKL